MQHADAREEGRSVGVGVLAFYGCKVYALSADVPVEWFDWMRQHSTKVINQAELIALHVAFLSLHAAGVCLAQLPVVVYTDSSTALAASSRGASAVVHLNTLAFAYRATLASLGIAFAYHEYVPSALNPSDPLSRIEGGLSASRLASLTSADLLRWCAVAGYCPTILAAVFPPLPEVLL